MSNSLLEIQAAATTYLEGLYEGDINKLASVFHPTSFLTYEENGALFPFSRKEWFEEVKNRKSPKERGLDRYGRILSIDLALPALALVKLEAAVPPRYYIDYLCFLKVERRWQVVQKVFGLAHEDAS